MTTVRPRPTLLVFTLGAAAERRRRRLLPQRLAAVEVALRGACLEAALAAGRAADCRLRLSCPTGLPLAGDVRASGQAGADFGSRLGGAVDEAFAAAAAPLVVVGTDVPGLTAAHLERALELLSEDPERVVVGPSPDGGFYLLAATRPIPGLARGVAWCSRRALATLRRLVAASGRPLALLEPLADLDRPADLDRWLADRAVGPLGWSALVRRLRRLLAALRRPHALAPPLARRPAAVGAVAGRSPPAPTHP